MEANLEKNDPLQLKPVQIAIELARPWVLFCLYVATWAAGWWFTALPLVFAAALAGFVQMHDAIHRSLGFQNAGMISFC